MRRFGYIFLVTFFTQSSYAQWSKVNDNSVFSFGVSSTMGTHQINLGVFFRFDYAYAQMTNRLQYKINFKLKEFGPNISYIESRLSNAIYFQFGNDKDSNDEMVLSQGYFTRKNAIGYELAFLMNKIGTRQSIGAISMIFNSWNIQFQNDLFGNLKGKDRFKTGAIALGYQHGETSVWLKSLLWTGETRCKGRKVEKDTAYPARYGFKNISDCLFSQFSHGVLALHVSHQFSIANEAIISIGNDSERVRHALQNRLIHDMCLLPKSMVKSDNPHIPMLDTDGNPYLFEKNKSVRKDKFYLQLGYNSLLLY